MDRYLVLVTLADQFSANQVCSALELQGIPVIIEHIQINNQGTFASGFRVLVPSHQSQRGLRIVGSLGYGSPANEDEASVAGQAA